jgi:hypothetical protein
MPGRALTVLQIINAALKEIGIIQASVKAATTSANKNVVQILALMQATADEMLLDQPYENTLGDGYWLVEPSTGQHYAYVQADTNLVLFDDRVFIDNLKARFLSANGLEYGESMRDYAMRLNKLAVRANRRVLDLDEGGGRIQ